MLAAWLLYPAVALAVAAGVGLGVERAAGTRLPGALIVPAGLAGVVALGQLTTYWNWSAELTVPLVLAAALAGWVLGRGRLRPLDPWLTAAAVGVFAVFAAPIVLSGEAAFAGYTVLGDTAFQLIGADALLEVGRDIAALPPSTTQATAAAYYVGSGYPSGGPVTAGVLSSLVRLDVAWTYQPFLALLAAASALAIWSLVTPLVKPRPLRALVALVAAQPAIVLAYALQGSIKELGTVFGALTVAASIPVYVGQRGVRRVLPLAVAAAAMIALVGPVAGLWLAPLLAGALVAAALTRPRPAPRALAAQVALFAVALAVLGYQSLAQLADYADVAGSVVQAQEELGNLIGPLSNLEVGGVWLSGDYRLRPAGDAWLLNRELLLVVGIGALLGLAWLLRRRAWPVLLYVVATGLAGAIVTARGSPWADAKALMISAPAVVLLALLGGAALWVARQRALAVLLAGLVTLGVLVSNALLYRDASIAPRDRMQELADIGQEIEGPTVFPAFDEFAKYFLRDARTDTLGDAIQRPANPWRAGQGRRFGFPADVDQLSDDALRSYRTIVTPRGASGSRPPSTYERVRAGSYYDVWRRDDDAPRLLEHLPVGFGREPSGRPDCAAVERLAATARRAGGSLRYLARPEAVGFAPSAAPLPGGWVVDGTDPATVRPVGPGRVERIVDVPAGGRFDLWIEASDARRWRVLVDGREVSDARWQIGFRGSEVYLGSVELIAGNHTFTLIRGGGSLRAGNGDAGRLIGPLALTPDPGALPVAELSPSRWRELCGRTVDWVDAVG